jgi:16S rRNA (guanine527-N7)-methyltransferase
MSFLPLDKLKSGALDIGIELSDAQLGQFDEFAAFLVETNEKFNLTRITDPEAIVIKHFLDSLLCLGAVEFAHGSRVIDIGTGAGFPGIPIKTARPDLRVTLVDSTSKKVRFLQQAIVRLGLEGVEAVHARAEEFAGDNSLREGYDVACCRALASLRIAAELCLPFVRIGGRMIAQKSEEIDQEVAEARPMMGKLGGRIEKIVRAHIPGTDIIRGLVVVQKAKVTPCEFPRAYAQIAKTKKRCFGAKNSPEA